MSPRNSASSRKIARPILYVPIRWSESQEKRLGLWLLRWLYVIASKVLGSPTAAEISWAAVTSGAEVLRERKLGSTLIPRDQEFGDSSRRTGRSAQKTRRDESRRCTQECVRHTYAITLRTTFPRTPVSRV